MSARATWKGLLQISRVAIPIKVYPATEASETISFHQLHAACQSRMQQKRWCPTCDIEVPAADVVKGFEFGRGQYVVLLPEELDAVQPASTHVIDLVQVVNAQALEYRSIDRAYYLVPDGPDGGPAQEAYALMGAAMAGQVGLGTIALYGREYPVAVDPFRGSLLLYTLHPAAGLREAPYRAETPRGTAASATLTLARRVVATLHRPGPIFVDQYQADLRRLIDAKIAGQEIIEPPIAARPPVLDLHAALTQSLLAVSAGKKTPAKAATVPKRKTA